MRRNNTRAPRFVPDHVSYGVIKVIQAQLFQDSTEWLTACAADVEVAGGTKVVGSKLWPELDPETASRKLSNALNRKQKQQLSYPEAQQVKRLARIASGKSQLHAFESKQLECDLHWRTADDVMEMATTRFAELSQQSAALQAEMQRAAELIASLQPRVR